jgi:hypothetical protein
MDLEQALTRIQQLEGDLKKFEGINPEEARRQQQTASEQIQNLTTQVQQFQTQIQDKEQALRSRDVRLAAVEGLYQANVLPEYRDVLLPTVTQSLKLDGDRVVAPEGRQPVEYVKSLRDKYPAMFAPETNPTGTGATGSTTTTQQPPSQDTVDAADPGAFITNLDAIATGKVQVNR